MFHAELPALAGRGRTGNPHAPTLTDAHALRTTVRTSDTSAYTRHGIAGHRRRRAASILAALGIVGFLSPTSASAVAVNHVNLVQAIKDSDLMGVLCLLGCLILSVISWAVIAYKQTQIGAASRQSDRFTKRLKSGSGSLEEAYKLTNRYPASPLAQILREAYLEMEMENWYSDSAYRLEDRMTACRVGLERVMERTISNEIRHMESYLIFLATTSNVAPFVGLFGTVWGVLGAFQALQNSGQAAISALAPGMATALVATIAGLVAAIPASIFYNVFNSRVSILISRMDAFALELLNVMQKRVLRQEAGSDSQYVPAREGSRRER